MNFRVFFFGFCSFVTRDNMYRIKIILMLSAIIPSLDCCCSRTLLHRTSINLYPTVELSMQKSTQFQHNDPQLETTPPSALSPNDNQTKLYGRHHNLQYDNGEESNEDEKKSKLNRSQISNLQNDEVQLEQKLEEDFFPPRNDDSQESIWMDESPDVTVEDAQYKLINEIGSIECVEWFRLEFCLNGGRCFLYPILNQSLSSCECAEGYVGERCEAKSFEFIERIPPRYTMAKAISGPLVLGLAVIDILLLLFLFCKNCNRD